MAPAVKQWPKGEAHGGDQVRGPRASEATGLQAVSTAWPGLGDRCAPSLSGIAFPTPSRSRFPGGLSFSSRSVSERDRACVPLGFPSPSQLLCSRPPPSSAAPSSRGVSTRARFMTLSVPPTSQPETRCQGQSKDGVL